MPNVMIAESRFYEYLNLNNPIKDLYNQSKAAILAGNHFVIRTGDSVSPENELHFITMDNFKAYLAQSCIFDGLLFLDDDLIAGVTSLRITIPPPQFQQRVLAGGGKALIPQRQQPTTVLFEVMERIDPSHRYYIFLRNGDRLNFEIQQVNFSSVYTYVLAWRI